MLTSVELESGPARGAVAGSAGALGSPIVRLTLRQGRTELARVLAALAGPSPASRERGMADSAGSWPCFGLPIVDTTTPEGIPDLRRLIAATARRSAR